MDFYKLAPQLLSSRNAVKKQFDNAMDDAMQDPGDLSELSAIFGKLSRDTFYTQLAQHEHGRATHMMYKTTFDSFQ
ncbi:MULTISPECIES: hypothetical protein [Pseudomonas]|uniref:Uncharacterized protein n=1 Tax=Pseudomonas tritici TaxID=2745518 RepID=A0A8H9Z1V4_9PSED|nr:MULTISPECIES: hypothetical protein [Pseudomonas]MBP2874499.1 hypothetical protein [Pseudomonas sp. SWRI144]MBW8125479.1 hypothetical protein [Pseudomonas sp. LAP_36]MBW8136906.1 hypothetical protein [Pseudomonas sp. PAMC 26818]QXH84804.1 hypothetical protein HU722_0004810 [Pseudomonas tritici]CRL96873.1 hypothetical protein [Pseudomonas sp. 24 E 1]